MDTLLATALRAADAAASAHQRWAGRVGLDEATRKGRGDFVSAADIEAQEAALTVIRNAHPDHGVLAEEEMHGVPGPPPLAPTWIVDPLDGTANFLHRHPMYAASIAFAIQGRPLVGAVSCATTGERWWGARGAGAWKNGRAIHVSGLRSLEGALVGTGFPFKVQHLIPEYLGQLGGVLRAGAGVRRGGSAALDLCYLAEGRLDGFWELFLNPWDFAAGIVIVEESGGLVTGLDRAPLPLEPGAVLGAGTAALLAELSDAIAVAAPHAPEAATPRADAAAPTPSGTGAEHPIRPDPGR